MMLEHSSPKMPNNKLYLMLVCVCALMYRKTSSYNLSLNNNHTINTYLMPLAKRFSNNSNIVRYEKDARL